MSSSHRNLEDLFRRAQWAHVLALAAATILAGGSKAALAEAYYWEPRCDVAESAAQIQAIP